MSKDNISKSTIMFTDIVGYSAMVNKDQEHAMELLSMHDKIIEPIIKQNGGEIIKKIGDSFFVEFQTPESSIITAQNAQIELAKRNEVSNLKDKVEIRIGLHNGDVIRKDDDLFGHDVNLCSRIESLAPAGGIAASADLIEPLSSKNFPYREMVYVKLKNISHPQKLYKIYKSKEEHELESSSTLQKYLQDYGIDIIDMDSYSIIDTFSFAVLYTKNLGAEEHESIAYSITEELINDLGYIDTLRIATMNDITQYNNSELDKSDIGRKLQVDNIIYGSILTQDNQTKLNFEFLDINTGKILWKDSWSDSIINLKNIRRHIIDGILQQFEIELPKELSDSLSEEMSTNTKAIEAYNTGKYCCLDFVEKTSDLEKARENLKTALDLDQNFIEAYYLLSITCERLGNLEEAESLLNKGLKIAEKKNSMRGKSHIHRGFYLLYIRWGKYAQAIEHVENALKIVMPLNNSILESQLRQDYATSLNKLQKPELSIEQNKQAVEIIQKMENERMLGVSYANLNDSYLLLGDFSQAIDFGEKAIAIFRKLNMPNLIAIASNWVADAHCRIGQYEEMNIKITEAEKLISGLNDFFREGKIDFFKSHYYLNNNDYTSALKHIDLSIDKFTLGKNTVQEIQSSIEKLKILIEAGSIEKTTRIITKIDYLINQIKGSYDNLIYVSIKYYVEAYNGTHDKNSIHKL